MSRPVKETIACPHCGKEQEFVCWTSVNASLDKQLKEELVSGRLTTFVCQRCRTSSHVEYDVLYHDMDIPLMVWLKYPDKTGRVSTESATPGMFDLLDDNYTFRLGTSFQDFLEKIRIFDDGLDDFTIELLKLMVCIRKQIDITEPLYYHRTESSLLAGQLIVLVYPEGDELVEFRYSARKQLPSVQAIQEKVVSSIQAEKERWILLDRSYVLRVLEDSGMMTRLEWTDALHDEEWGP